MAYENVPRLLEEASKELSTLPIKLAVVVAAKIDSAGQESTHAAYINFPPEANMGNALDAFAQLGATFEILMGSWLDELAKQSNQDAVAIRKYVYRKTVQLALHQSTQPRDPRDRSLRMFNIKPPDKETKP